MEAGKSFLTVHLNSVIRALSTTIFFSIHRVYIFMMMSIVSVSYTIICSFLIIATVEVAVTVAAEAGKSFIPCSVILFMSVD